MSRPLRFEGKTMEAARQRALEHLGTDVSELTVLRHGRELSGGLFGFFQRERFVIEVEDPQADAARPAQARANAPQPPIRQAALPQAIAVPDRLAALLEATTDTVGLSFDRELRGVIEDAEAVVSDAAETSGLVSASVLPATEPYSIPAGGGPAPRAITLGVSETSSAALRDRLAAAGLAEEYLPDPFFSQPALALPLRLGALPPPCPVPSRPGDVLVLVGDVDESVKVAERVARRIGEDATVIVVSHRRLSPSPAHVRAHNPLEAGTMVLKRRLAGLVSVVVLDSLCRDGFVPLAVAGLRPDASWAVVPASWDEGRARTLESVVGRFAAIAIYGFLSTDRPAGLIGRGWPVAYLDGWEASPLSIAARLVEAVTADL
ncbi:MAG: Jag N-terminal domain-containing protein [Acidimicrobiales bacterium]